MAKISIDPDKLEGLANGLVTEMASIEETWHNLEIELYQLQAGCEPEYSYCLSGIGDNWSPGRNLLDELSNAEIYIRDTASKFADQDNYIQKLYNLHSQYGTMTALGGTLATQGVYYLMGLTRFSQGADGRYVLTHNPLLQKVGDMVDNSRFRGPIRTFISPTSRFTSSRLKPTADLIHKKYTKFLPTDAVDLANNVQGFKHQFRNPAAPKVSFKEVVRAGGKLARGNAIVTGLVTAGSEAFGAGLKISDNYAKYGDNPAVLKRENAKAVGNAVNNTVAITAGSTAGAILGGTIGSLAGPVGTVIGATVGSFVGGLVGEQAAKLTSGLAQKAAIAMKEPINAGINLFREGFQKAGKIVGPVNDGIDAVNKEIKKGFNKVKDTAGSLMNGAKSFFGKKLSFG
ncbi:glycine zipper domain-containing protein [Bacillus massiliglaciei]|uniref:glycine zipper domain-containing protein n=1 Tax=Bacillus massiliglaciei TaxID=1816693 RepID=UPI000B1684BA|nr:glycine zipper domain-containing protein [Bacillus massiliglaciei]